MFRQWAQRPDSGGPGQHHGGLGGLYEIELVEEQANVFLFGERGKFPPPGVVGGQAGAGNHFVFDQDDGEHEPPFVSKMVGIILNRVNRGQTLRLETPGSGGYGPLEHRDPALIAKDTELGYISQEPALEDYKAIR